MSGGEAAGFVEYVWGQYKFVAVFNVAVDEVVEQGPFEAGAVADVKPEARSAHFDAAFVVDQAQMGDEIDVVLRLKVGGGFSPHVRTTRLFSLSPGVRRLRVCWGGFR